MIEKSRKDIMEGRKYRFTDLKGWAHNWIDVQPSLGANRRETNRCRGCETSKRTTALGHDNNKDDKGYLEFPDT